MQWERISCRHRGTVVVVDLVGRFCLCGEWQVLGVVADLWWQGDRKVLLNLAGVPLMDSGDLGQTVRVYRYVVDQGGRFGLCGLSTPIKQALQITRLAEVFEVFETEDAGVQALDAAPDSRIGPRTVGPPLKGDANSLVAVAWPWGASAATENALGTPIVRDLLGSLLIDGIHSDWPFVMAAIGWCKNHELLGALLLPTLRDAVGVRASSESTFPSLRWRSSRDTRVYGFGALANAPSTGGYGVFHAYPLTEMPKATAQWTDECATRLAQPGNFSATLDTIWRLVLRQSLQVDPLVIVLSTWARSEQVAVAKLAEAKDRMLASLLRLGPQTSLGHPTSSQPTHD